MSVSPWENVAELQRLRRRARAGGQGRGGGDGPVRRGAGGL